MSDFAPRTSRTGIGIDRTGIDGTAPAGNRDPGDDGTDGRPPSLDGFDVGRLLGRGGSSLVWLVTDDGGQRFALKVAGRPLSGPGPEVLRTTARTTARRGRRAAGAAAGTGASDGWAAVYPRYAPADVGQELRLLQGFRHDHLLPVHRILETDQGPGLLMDLAAGGSLLGLVASRGPLPIPEVVTALAPIAQALGHLHRAGASHGDVTPANILFTHEGKPLLADFGTARLLGADPEAVVGTPGFVDPSSAGSFDTRADVFALAAVAWFALTGRIPGPTEQRPPLALVVPDVPRILMQLIEDGLSSSTDRRPSADDVARTLLASSAPVAVNLVPAVHTSVLPELLTQRAAGPSVPPREGWRRILHGHPRRRQRPSPQVSSTVPPPARRRKVHSESIPAGPARVHSRTDHSRTDGHGRRRLALAAGLAAGALLLAGIALTLGGPVAPEQLLTRPASQSGGATDGELPASQGVTEPAPVDDDRERDGIGDGTSTPLRSALPGAGPSTLSPRSRTRGTAGEGVRDGGSRPAGRSCRRGVAGALGRP
ncbi:protein kinase [Vibrio cholerae]|nr:protein kinase [Vibrio cholerae]